MKLLLKTYILLEKRKCDVSIYLIIRRCARTGAFPGAFCVPNSVALASPTLWGVGGEVRGGEGREGREGRGGEGGGEGTVHTFHKPEPL